MQTVSYAIREVQNCPDGYIASECWKCHCGVFIREHTPDTPACPQCRRALIEGEFGRIKGDVLDIIKGRGEWEWSSIAERNRFLRELRQIASTLIPPPPVRPAPSRAFPAGRCEVPTAADICAMLDTEEEGVEVPEVFELW